MLKSSRVLRLLSTAVATVAATSGLVIAGASVASALGAPNVTALNLTHDTTHDGAVVDGHFLYISELFSNDVAVVDLATKANVATIPTAAGPEGLAASGGKLFVAVPGSDGSGSSVQVIDESTRTVTTTIAVGANPRGVLAFANRIWVTNASSGTVSVIDPATLTVISTLTIGTGPFHITGGVINGTSLVFVGYNRTTVAVLNASNGTKVKDLTVTGDINDLDAHSGELDLTYAYNDGANHRFLARYGADLVNHDDTELTATGFGLTHVGIFIYVAELSASKVLVYNTGTGDTTSVGVFGGTSVVVPSADAAFAVGDPAMVQLSYEAVPSPPTAVTATPSDGSVTVSWTPPAASTPAVTGYRVSSSGTAGAEDLRNQPACVSSSASATSCTVTGLTDGTPYWFTVQAVSPSGSSVSSSEVSATPAAPIAPGAPTGLTATAGNGQVVLSWTAPTTGGAPTSYIALASTTSGTESGLYCTASTTTCTVTGLTNGTTYYFVVEAHNAAGYSNASDEASATPLTTPSAPSNLLATPANGSVSLSWTASANTGGAPVTYYAYAGTASGAEMGPECTATVTTCTVGGLTNGTKYYFLIQPRNTAGAGPLSNEATATPAAVAPGAPTGLIATAGNAQVSLSWTAPASDGGAAVSYEVFQSTSAGAEADTSTPVCSGTVTSCTVSSLTNGTAYFFKVQAVNSAGKSALSNEASATPVAPATVPGAPTGLTATAGNAQVSLSWTAPASNGGSAITSYKVYAGTTSGSYPTVVCTVAAPATTCTATGLTNGTKYFFTVQALNSAGSSGNATEASATPVAPATVPGAPTGLTATAGNAQVSLSWTAPASNGGSAITGYSLYEGTSAGNDTLTGLCTSTATSCTVTGLTNGTKYFFVVRANNAVGQSANSNESSATPVAPATVPGAPTGLIATAGNAQVSLSWTAPASNGGSAITGYSLYEGTSAGNDTLTGLCTSTATSCTVTGLTNGTKYFFVVRANNAVGQSANSNESSATPVAPATVPGTPTGLIATAGNAQVSLSWTAPASNGGSAITGYSLYEGTSAGNDTLTGLCTSTATSCTVTGLTNGTKYFFVVRANNAVGQSANSNESSATPVTVPAPPTGITATAGNASIVVSWTPTPTASNGGSPVTEYQVFDSVSSNHEQFDTSYACHVTGASATTCTITALPVGTTQFIQVEALNAVGRSALSAEASATPFTVPGAPTALTATPGNAQVMFSWTAPVSNGGSVITGYEVRAIATSGAEDQGDIVCTATTATTCTATALHNGTTYYATVKAINAAGRSAGSNEASATPITVPAPPTGVTATSGNTSVTVSWTPTPSTADGGSAITSYQVFSAVTTNNEQYDTAYACQAAASATSCTVTGLTNGTKYFFQVEALNAAGRSTLSTEASATPSASLPGAPTGLGATAGDGKVSLSWTAPASNGGAPITAYKVFQGLTAGAESTTGTPACTVNTTSCTVTGLSDGTAYFFTVVAVNTTGASAPSNEASTTPAGVPGAPTGLSATSGSGSLSFSWTAPASNGGSPLTGYRVIGSFTSHHEADAGVVVCTVTTTSCTVSGLANGTTYFFTVEAVNAIGHSADSAEAAGTPVGAPTAPLGLSATGGLGQVALSWAAPASNGGSAITGYRVLTSAGAVACTTTATSCTLVGLADATTYSYVVVALNALGASTPSAVASATTAPAPTAKLTGATGKATPASPAAVVASSKQSFAGTTTPGATVVLTLAGKTITTTKATSKGTYTLTGTLKKSGTYTISTLGRTIATFTVKVTTLTVHVKGTKITGKAPAGTKVSLLVDGKTKATTTATKKGTYTFTRTLHGHHTIKTKDQNVTTKTTTIKAQ